MITDLTSEKYLATYVSQSIKDVCKKYELEPEIVASLICQESIKASKSLLDSIFATRYEPGFYYRYIMGKKLTGFIPKGSIPNKSTERRQRATSYGLMQIMGATAREHGLETQYITSLCEPRINIEIGCKILKHFYVQEGKDYREALRRYNGRSRGDYSYTVSVIDILKNEEYLPILQGR